MSFVHSPKIVTDGLVLALDAGNTKSYTSGSTTWFDKSGNANNGTLTNGPTFNSANGGSIVFDGVDDYASISGNTTINIPGDYTIEVWINTDTISISPSVKVITSQWGTDPKSMYLGFFPNNSISHYRTLADNTHYNVTFAISSSDFVNKWNQVVGITSGSVLQIWSNGSLKGSASWPGVASVPNQPLLISGISPGTQSFSGKVASTKIYNRALSAAEIQQNFNALRGRYGI
jgi:hypothetical protein